MATEVIIDVWGRYRVILDSEAERLLADQKVRSQLTDLINKLDDDVDDALDETLVDGSRLVTRYIFDEKMIRPVEVKYRLFDGSLWALNQDTDRLLPVEFAKSRSYLYRLSEAVQYGSVKDVLQLWFSYFDNNRYLAHKKHKVVYVGHDDPSFTILNYVSMMADHLPWISLDL